MPSASLHELLVIMGIITLLLPTGLGWVHRAMKTHRQTQQSASSQLVLARLAADLRRDFELAAAATLHTHDADQGPDATDGPLVDLVMEEPSGGTIRWTRRGTRLVREVELNQQITHREEYNLPELARAIVSRGDLDGLVKIEIWMSEPLASRTGRAADRQELQVEVFVRGGQIQAAMVGAEPTPAAIVATQP